MKDFAKPIHVVLSNYGYDTAQARSRVVGPFIGTRTIGRLRLSAKSRESRRDSSETRQSTVKTQLERLRIMAYYRCFTEFCKGLYKEILSHLRLADVKQSWSIDLLRGTSRQQQYDEICPHLIVSDLHQND